MSKLRDRIRDMSRRRPTALGFAIVRGAERSPRQVLVLAEVWDASAASTAVAAGCDALIYGGSLDSLADVVAAADGRPVGARVEAATAADTAAIATAGADFLVFDDQRTDAGALVDTRLGYVAVATDVTDDAALRLLRPLDLDAVLIAAPAEQLKSASSCARDGSASLRAGRSLRASRARWPHRRSRSGATPA